MRFLRRSRDGASDRLDLDQVTTERLLAGTLARDDAPPGYRSVAAVLAAAAAPAEPAELAGEAEARAAFRAARPAAAPVPSRPHHRRGRVAVLVAGVIMLGATSAAAATGNLPGQARDAVSDLLDRAGVSGPGNAGPAVSSDASGEGVGPDTAGPAGFGLCTAFADRGEGSDSVAFRALLAMVGEADVAEFCADVTPGNGDEPGAAGAPPGLGGNPPPGQGGAPPGLGEPPGLGGNPPPGQGGDPPGLGGNPPPGQGGNPPPGQGGNPPPGQGGDPPGLGDVPPPGLGGDPPGLGDVPPPGLGRTLGSLG